MEVRVACSSTRTLNKLFNQLPFSVVRGPKLEHDEAATRKRQRISANFSVAHHVFARTSLRDDSLTRQKGLSEGAVRGRAELNPEQAATLHSTLKCYLRCYLEPDYAEEQTR